MKTIRTFLTVLLFTSALSWADHASAARNHIIGVGTYQGAEVVIVTVDWDEDGTWDEYFYFATLVQAQDFIDELPA